MSITATTLSAAMTSTDNSLQVAAATGISAPVNPTGSGFTYLMIDNELLFVTAISGTVASVLRGQSGTRAVSHAVSTPVLIGGPSDFPNFVPATLVTTNVKPENFNALSAPFTGATIAPKLGQSWAHFTGTTALVTITVPTGLENGGAITLVFDGSSSGLTWTAADNIAVAGTSTTAASAVTFTYDAVTAKWHPSRLA